MEIFTQITQIHKTKMKLKSNREIIKIVEHEEEE